MNVRVGVITADDALVDDLAGAFVTERLQLRSVLREPERVPADVVLVDARLQNHLMNVSRLVAEGTFAVVVMARAQNSADAMRYLDVGALDVVWGGSPAATLHARLRSAARHARPAAAEWTPVGDLAVSRTRREVRRRGELVHLTPTEYRLLETLLEAGGRTLSHHEILGRVWGPNSESSRHQLRVYVRQLREKIEVDPSAPKVVLTDPGKGYRLETHQHAAARAV